MNRKQLIDLAASQVALEYVLTKHAGVKQDSDFDWNRSMNRTMAHIKDMPNKPMRGGTGGAILGGLGGAAVGGLGGAAYESLFGDAENSQYTKRMLQGAGVGGALGAGAGYIGLGNMTPTGLKRMLIREALRQAGKLPAIAATQGMQALGRTAVNPTGAAVHMGSTIGQLLNPKPKVPIVAESPSTSPAPAARVSREPRSPEEQELQALFDLPLADTIEEDRARSARHRELIRILNAKQNAK